MWLVRPVIMPWRLFLDAEYEAAHGATPTAMAGLLMQRYMAEFEVEIGQFEGFSINAHANGSKNPKAMFRNLIKPGRFAGAPVVAPPVNLFDSAPEGRWCCCTDFDGDRACP